MFTLEIVARRNYCREYSKFSSKVKTRSTNFLRMVLNKSIYYSNCSAFVAYVIVLKAELNLHTDS